ncbi:MAG TPA: recombination protein RecR [Dehalococcoidia bacterium]|nr:recombination protein RecR [Dehalococcoidia bacterium]
MDHGSIPAANAINHLVQELSKLPGIGPKSAQRITYHLLRSTPEQTGLLSDAIRDVKQQIMLCSTCCNLTDVDPCPICRNEQRDRTTICVVEQPQDILAIEHTGIYRGLYHVLHGAISPTEGVGAGDVRIRELTDRLQDGTVQEIILATNTNLEGEQTALYLNHILAPIGVRVTRLAHGLPFGTELEYADDTTLTRAIEGRQAL